MTADLEAKVDSTLLWIEQNLKTFERPVLMFSGGKDSIVTAHLVSQVIKPQVFSEMSVLFDKEIEDVRRAAKELGLKPKESCQLTFERIVLNSKIMLPPCTYIYSNIDKNRHWISMPRFAKEVNADLMVYGRRKQENTIPSKLYWTKKHGNVAQAHPIADWKLEDVWGYIKSRNLFYPECYDNGSAQLRTWLTFLNKEAQEHGVQNALSQLYIKQPNLVWGLAKAGWEPAQSFF